MADEIKRADAADDRGRWPLVEIYRPVSGRTFAYRVVAAADGDSAEALRAAKALALEIEQELHEDLAGRLAERQRKRESK